MIHSLAGYTKSVLSTYASVRVTIVSALHVMGRSGMSKAADDGCRVDRRETLRPYSGGNPLLVSCRHLLRLVFSSIMRDIFDKRREI